MIAMPNQHDFRLNREEMKPWFRLNRKVMERAAAERTRGALAQDAVFGGRKGPNPCIDVHCAV